MIPLCHIFVSEGSVLTRRPTRSAIRSLFLLVLTLSACQNLPTATHEGDIQHVIIGKSVASSALDAKVGDEIRWTNTGVGPVRILFMDRIIDLVSCRRNFCGYFTGGLEAILSPQESASLCFGDPGNVRYTITLPSTLSSEPVSRQGLIQIGLSDLPLHAPNPHIYRSRP